MTIIMVTARWFPAHIGLFKYDHHFHDWPRVVVILHSIWTTFRECAKSNKCRECMNDWGALLRSNAFTYCPQPWLLLAVFVPGRSLSIYTWIYKAVGYICILLPIADALSRSVRLFKLDVSIWTCCWHLKITLKGGTRCDSPDLFVMCLTCQ